MVFKKKEFFLLIFLILLQSCSGGRIGNFLEISFNDLEKVSQEESQKNLENKKIVVQENENKEMDYKNNEEIKKVEIIKSVQENKKIVVQENENKEMENKNYEEIKKVEEPISVLEKNKDKNSKNIQKQKNNKIKNSSDKGKIELHSYKILLILKDVDPKDPTEELSTILRNSEVDFEIEKIERLLDSKNKSINKN